MKEITRKWFRQASYDLKTAEAMFETRRYLYVAFMCQQAVEKLLKGIIYEQAQSSPPFTHRLSVLAEIASVEGSGDQRDFLDLLTRFYINSRYPEQKQDLASGLNRKVASDIIQKTKDCFKWLKKELRIQKRS